jgi:hypothetical protein
LPFLLRANGRAGMPALQFLRLLFFKEHKYTTEFTLIADAVKIGEEENYPQMNTDKHKLFFGFWLLAFGFCVVFSATAQQPKMSSRILLIPLDDRPPCLQFPVKMGAIGDAEMVTPPRELLGRFTEFGKSDEIVAWLKKQNLRSFDAAIVSVDMLAYGGLVAMREYKTDEATARRRLEFVREMRKIAPKLKIYGSSVIMRLAPTGNVVNEAYREKLARWAEISVDENLKKETEKLEREIPAQALADYKAARARDLKINLASIDLVRDKIFDYLILSQDDAKPKGVHISDREKLMAEIRALKLAGKIAVQPGADEVSMLLLARALTDKYNYHPKIKAVYSSEKIADEFMPYEDRPLRQTVSFHIKAAGAREVKTEAEADILFYVFVSRFEKDGAQKFFNKIVSDNWLVKDLKTLEASQGFKGNKKIIIADVDPKGDVQGGDVDFSEKLIENGVHFLPILDGYATWNTAGNTIGTALPQGIIMANSNDNLLNLQALKDKEYFLKKAFRIYSAQTWFLLNRFIDDYLYHSLVRPEAIKFARENKWNPFRFDETSARKVEKFTEEKMIPKVRVMLEQFSLGFNQNNTEATFVRYRKDKLANSSLSVPLTCKQVKNFNFILPWNRTFEAEIDFDLDCEKMEFFRIN